MLSPLLMLSLAGASTSHSSSGDRPATSTTGTSDTTHSTCGGAQSSYLNNHYGKRSADPAYHPYGLVLSHNNNVYSGFTGNHYATGLPGHSFAAVTHLGKREAEPTADADADAEADPYYGYYGYGRRYGYGLGYRGYYGHGYGLGYGYGYYG